MPSISAESTPPLKKWAPTKNFAEKRKIQAETKIVCIMENAQLKTKCLPRENTREHSVLPTESIIQRLQKLVYENSPQLFKARKRGEQFVLGKHLSRRTTTSTWKTSRRDALQWLKITQNNSTLNSKISADQVVGYIFGKTLFPPKKQREGRVTQGGNDGEINLVSGRIQTV